MRAIVVAAAIRATRTGSTPAATGAARCACAGSAPKTPPGSAARVVKLAELAKGVADAIDWSCGGACSPRRARRRSLADFGDDDVPCRAARAAAHLRGERVLREGPHAQPPPAGDAARDARSRSRTRCAQHPEVLARPVKQPVVLTGLPRSATSALFNLFGEDPAARPLRLWETQCPDPLGAAARRARSRAAPRSSAYYAQGREKRPEFTKIHFTSADTPEECVLLHAYAMHGVQLGRRGRCVEPYASWYQARDRRPARALRVPEAADAAARLAAAGRALAAEGARAPVGPRRADRDLPRRRDRVESPRPGRVHRVRVQHDRRR